MLFNHHALKFTLLAGITLIPTACVVQPGHRHVMVTESQSYPAASRWDYYYYPDEEVYYNSSTGYYFYLDNGVWMSSITLPSRFILDHGYRYQIRIQNERPYVYHKQHREKYHPRHKNPTVIIREPGDSHHHGDNRRDYDRDHRRDDRQEMRHDNRHQRYDERDRDRYNDDYDGRRDHHDRQDHRQDSRDDSYNRHDDRRDDRRQVNQPDNANNDETFSRRQLRPFPPPGSGDPRFDKRDQPNAPNRRPDEAENHGRGNQPDNANSDETFSRRQLRPLPPPGSGDPRFDKRDQPNAPNRRPDEPEDHGRGNQPDNANSDETFSRRQLRPLPPPGSGDPRFEKREQQNPEHRPDRPFSHDRGKPADSADSDSKVTRPQLRPFSPTGSRDPRIEKRDHENPLEKKQSNQSSEKERKIQELKNRIKHKKSNSEDNKEENNDKDEKRSDNKAFDRR